MYELPFGRARAWVTSVPRIVAVALGGWQVSAVGYPQSGMFLTPTITPDHGG